MRWILALTSLSLLVAGSAGGHEFVLEPRWSRGGTGGSVGEYGIPESVAIDSLGQVVVTDKGRMMLHVYAAATGQPLFDVARPGSALGSLDRPNGVAVTANGTVLVVEQVNRRVQRFDAEYRPLGSFGGGFQKPMGIALDDAGRIYVTDEARADIQVFDPTGARLWTFGADPRLARVESIEIDTAGQRIFVCDEGRSRVNVYDLQGRYTGGFGSQGSGPGQFGNDPNAVRLDGRGRIYVNDQGNGRINVYRPDLTFLASFRNTGRAMESADGMALSERHNLLLVADQGNDRVLAFDLGEIQCHLERLELESVPVELLQLDARTGVVPLDLETDAVWEDAVIDFEARVAGGDPGQQEILHAVSGRDPRGVCVRLSEIEPASDRLAGRLRLGEATDAAATTLAVHEEDSLRLHVPWTGFERRVAVRRFPAPRVEALRAGLGRDGRVYVDTPTFTWSFVDPAGRRTQSAVRLELALPEGSPLWESGVVPTADGSLAYTGPALPPGVQLELRLQVGSGRSWSDWARAPLRRNSPPRGAHITTPRPGGERWPVELRAAITPDPDGDPQRVYFEILGGGGALVATRPLVALDDTVRYWARELAPGERPGRRARAVVCDGFESVPSAWVHLDGEAGADASDPPRRIELPGHSDPSTPPDVLLGPGTRAAHSEPTPPLPPTPLPLGASLRLAPRGPALAALHDVRGRLIGTIPIDAEGTCTWDGRDGSGRPLAPGIYFLRLAGQAAGPRHRVVWLGR